MKHADLVFLTLLTTALTVYSSTVPMGPPPVASPTPKNKPKAKPTKEQVQIEVDSILKEAEQRRLKNSEQERQIHDAMFTTIFKAVREDSAPEPYMDLFHRRQGQDQDDLTRADILPTMWSRYRISLAMGVCSITDL